MRGRQERGVPGPVCRYPSTCSSTMRWLHQPAAWSSAHRFPSQIRPARHDHAQPDSTGHGSSDSPYERRRCTAHRTAAVPASNRPAAPTSSTMERPAATASSNALAANASSTPPADGKSWYANAANATSDRGSVSASGSTTSSAFCQVPNVPPAADTTPKLPGGRQPTMRVPARADRCRHGSDVGNVNIMSDATPAKNITDQSGSVAVMAASCRSSRTRLPVGSSGSTSVRVQRDPMSCWSARDGLPPDGRSPGEVSGQVTQFAPMPVCARFWQRRSARDRLADTDVAYVFSYTQKGP